MTTTEDEDGPPGGLLAGFVPDDTGPPEMPVDRTPPLDLSEVIRDLAQQSEAGEALVIAANLEDWLQHLITMFMRDPLSNEMAKDIFGRSLQSFGSRITIAYALELIDGDTRTNLVVIKDIRNAFAHARSKLHFASPEIEKLAKRFTGGNSGITNRLLFGNKAHACVEAMRAKIDRQLYVRAVRGHGEDHEDK